MRWRPPRGPGPYTQQENEGQNNANESPKQSWPPVREDSGSIPCPQGFPPDPNVILPPVRESGSEEMPKLPPLRSMLGPQEGLFMNAQLPPSAQHASVGPPILPMQMSPLSSSSMVPPPVVPLPQSATEERSSQDEQSVAMSVYMAESDIVPQVLANGRFQCPLCPRNYKYAKHVRRHIINHTDVYPYACTQCNALFRRNDALRRHMQRIHPDIPPNTYMNPRAAPDHSPDSSHSTMVKPKSESKNQHKAEHDLQPKNNTIVDRNADPSPSEST